MKNKLGPVSGLATTALLGAFLAGSFGVSDAYGQDGVFEAKVGAEGKVVQYRWNDSSPPLLIDFGLAGINDLTRAGPLRSPNVEEVERTVTVLELDSQGNPVKFERLPILSYAEGRVEIIDNNGNIGTAGLYPVLDDATAQKIASIAKVVGAGSGIDESIVALTLFYRQLEHTAALQKFDSSIPNDPSGYPAVVIFPALSEGVMKANIAREWRLVERPIMNGAARERTVDRSVGRSDSGTIGIESSAEFARRSLTGSSSEAGGGGSASFSLGPIEIGGSAEGKSTSSRENEASQTFAQGQNLSQTAQVDQNLTRGEKVILEANTAYAFWTLWDAAEVTVDGLDEKTVSVIEFESDGKGGMRPVQRRQVGQVIREGRYVINYDDSGSRDVMPR